MSLGITIRNLREQKNIERIDLANTLGISYHALSKYENDDRAPDYDTLVKLADFFNVSVDYLLGRKSSNTTPKYPTPDDVPDELVKQTAFIQRGMGKMTEEQRKTFIRIAKAFIQSVENGDEDNW